MKNQNLTILILLIVAIQGLSVAANPQVTFQISGAASGSIVIELYADEAPVTVANFIDYVQAGFYDGLIFHRVISGFMVQGGGFDTNLVQQTTGDPIINESSNRLLNLRGKLAMARTTLADTATSQFFINVADNAFLDYGYYSYDYNYNPPKLIPAQIGYCVFGEVISGMTVVDAIEALPTQSEGGMTDVPVNDVIIQSATISLNVPVCAEKLEGDANGDCSVNFADFVKLAQNWLACNSITSVCY
ncbi:MAG: peptidylprolyl isomerase [Planctomycetota bacterium]|jgi:cyclophilin family peptidyl-prolyl cis-trans isomerase